MTGLAIAQQADFSKGMYRNPSPELIPKEGVQDAFNALLEEDGSIFRRGGSVYKSSPDFAANLTFLWDGWTAGGNRTLFASLAAFGTLAADDITPSLLGPSIATGTDGQRAASGSGLVFVPTATLGSILMWGGSRASAIYNTGTITTTALSRTVTGAGTAWLANVEAGTLLFSPTVGYVGAVSTVESNTSLTLQDFAQGTPLSAVGYTLWPSAAITTPAGATDVFVATAGDPSRLLVGHRNKVAFSAAGNPTSFAAADYHQMPEGQIVGLAGIQDQAFVFTTGGVYVISNLNYNLVDALGNVQQKVSQLTKDVTLLNARGIAGYRNQLVVPGVDDVWLMGPAQYPTPISDPIRALYRAYVQAGYVCGHGAVYRNHYVLPIITTANVWVDTLICRLDQGGWTHWGGHGGTSVGFAERSTRGVRMPILLSANARRIVDMSGAWQPTATNATEADGTIHSFAVTTRDYPTGQAANRNLVKKVRVRYDMQAPAGGPAAVLKAYYGSGALIAAGPQWGAATWGSFTWGGSTTPGFIPLQGSANGGDAPPDSGNNPFPWLVGQQAPTFFRYRLICYSATPKLVIREIDSFIRSRSRQ